MRSLQIPIPELKLPKGFTIRSVAGEEEADAVQAVHASAYGSSTWQPGEYRDVMRTPGFHVDRELVVVAPDGRFAAFLIYWVDPISKSGLFEPVGCHKDFQRLGLTKALMYEGMRRMSAQGMTSLSRKTQPLPHSIALSAFTYDTLLPTIERRSYELPFYSLCTSFPVSLPRSFFRSSPA